MEYLEKNLMKPMHLLSIHISLIFSLSIARINAADCVSCTKTSLNDPSIEKIINLQEQSYYVLEKSSLNKQAEIERNAEIEKILQLEAKKIATEELKKEQIKVKNENELEKALRVRQENNSELLLCVQDILKSARGSIQLEIAAKYVDEGIKNYADSNKMAKLNRLCKQYSNDSGKSQKQKTDEITNIKQILPKLNAMNLNPKTLGIFESFLTNKISCDRKGYGVRVAAYFGFSLALDAKYCQNALGKRWVEFAPAFGIGAGIEFASGFRKNTKEETSSRMLLDLNTHEQFGAEIFMSTDKSRQSQKNLGSGSLTEDKGFGVAQYAEVAPSIKLIPLKTNREYLGKLLEK